MPEAFGAWRAFAFLSRRRPAGFSEPGAIPLTELESWCRLIGAGFDEREELLELVEALDREFLAQRRAAAE
jgi:hypothetical protein